MGRRIGIVGAGVSGLTCAHHLRRAGYRDVTVLEREDRVGGKCCSVTIDGRSYELGAVIGTRDYTAMAELGNGGRVGGTAAAARCCDVRGRPVDLIPWYEYPHALRVLLLNYAWLRGVRYRRVAAPGHAGMPPDLYEPFGRFARAHGLPLLNHVMAPPFTAFGYGSLEEVPTAYVLKYLDLPTIDALHSPKRRVDWPAGVATTLARAARGHDVRTGEAVRQVVRGDTVVVQTDAQQYEFDALILTCPLDEAITFLDATDRERRLFGAIRYDDYWVLLCRTSGLPDWSGYIPANFDRRGHVMLWYRRSPGDTLCALYVLGDFAVTAAQIEAACAADLALMGASLQRVEAVRRWRYFPHIGTADMASGWYADAESLQGLRGTYYAGEVMSFASIEQCARYARALVRRCFA